MPARDDLRLAASNLAAIAGVNPVTIQSWDPDLWRGPRLLVPIHVEALVVSGGQDTQWAEVRLDTDPEAPGDSDVPQVPVPFSTFTGRPDGVHLHWALPDGLTVGDMDAEDSDTSGFPLIPDRWVVIRLSPGNTPEAPRRAVGWVVESEVVPEIDPRTRERIVEPVHRVTPLEVWKEKRPAPRGRRLLTALGKGDPAYAAHYDNVREVLGFHDDLQGVSHGPLTYLVAGWYSRPADDPLYSARTQTEWLERLGELGWELQGETEDPLDRVKRANEAASRAAETGGLRWASPQPARDVSRIRTGLDSSTLSGVEMSGVSFLHEGLVRDDWRQFGPLQLLCHGMTYEVPWKEGGGRYGDIGGTLPDGTGTDLAVGNTAVEALAALVSRNDPERDRLTEAFHYGFLAELDHANGIAALESLLHAEDFESRDGGEDIVTLSPVTLEEPESAGPPIHERLHREIHAPIRSPFDVRMVDLPELVGQLVTELGDDGPFQAGARPGPGLYRCIECHRTLRLVLGQTLPPCPGCEPGGKTLYVRVYDPPEAQETRRARPRYWRPRDPMILLSGIGRSFKHGADGRFSASGFLPCRLTGETVKEMILGKVAENPVVGRVYGAGLRSGELNLGQLPPEVGRLLDEAILFDEASAPVAAESVRRQYQDWASVSGTELETPSGLEERIRTLQTGAVHYQKDRLLKLGLNVPIMVDFRALVFPGVVPLPLAVRAWRHPWAPVQVEWEVEWIPSSRGIADWRLDEHDWVPEASEGSAAGAQGPRFTGRDLLHPSAVRTMAARIADLLEDERAGISDTATPQQEEELSALRDELESLDVLSASMGGFHERLLGHVERYRSLGEQDEPPAVEDTHEVDPDAPTWPVRAGHLRLVRLRVVDAFGQFHDVAPGLLAEPARESSLESDDPALIRMAPRIAQPSRLMFRLLSATSDQAEADRDHSPVCGWVVPDHLDQALEMFDPAGTALGQLQLKPPATGLEPATRVEWQGVPGEPGSFGRPPALSDPRLQELVDGMLRWSERDAREGVGEAKSRSESALTALLRAIETTAATIDPLGTQGGEHLSVLVGRPIAVVRAMLHLELEDPPVDDSLLETAFSVRLGEVSRMSDGLVGYFVNDDYERFHPIHEVVTGSARPFGPFRGYLSSVDTVGAFHEKLPMDPIRHPYMERDPHVRIRPEQKVLLTLLLDPRGGVHATSGILPRKRIDLLRDHVTGALASMAFTFRVGPILTNPDAVRMPLPKEIGGTWKWIRRTGLTLWEEGPVTPDDGTPRLPPTPSTISEGWLRLSGAMNRDQ